MTDSGHKVIGVIEGSIAEEVGIEQGDLLIQINGTEIVDIIDYIEWMELEYLELLILKKDGEEWEVEIEKDAGEDLGIKFEHDLIDEQRACSNKCIFCFIDQLPKGMRDSLYYKDDDWRLSFLMGNYVTLTNMSDCDIDRIVEKHISPLYVSVHTTNPELRKRMLNNKFGGDVLKYLYTLANANIQLHCQIVLCPGWNDGDELDRTIQDLWALRHAVQSTAVVPVGLTSHRENLQVLSPFTAETADKVIEQVETWQNKCRAETEIGFIYAADEFYVLSGRDFPPYEEYDEFPQVENGIGTVVQFTSEFKEALSEYKEAIQTIPNSKRITIVTGKSANEIISKMAQEVTSVYGVEILVVPVENYFFGTKVTVAGLVTGGDIITALKGKNLGEKVLIPHVMLRKGEDVFLDDITLPQLIQAIGVPVIAVSVYGEDFLNAILN